MPESNATMLDFDRRTSDLLAPWTYHSEEFLQLEKARLFNQHWQLVGHLSDLPEARDYLTLDALGERALVVRGDDGEVRAFHNVCRHRGAKLVEGARGQCRRALTCAFHGWSYRLDGALLGVPKSETFKNLNKAENGLVPLPMEIWMGFVFVNFSVGKPPSLAQRMKPVAHLLEPYQLHKMKPLEDARSEEAHSYNWKVFHDIDNEGYHVPNGHPALQQLYGNDYRDDAIGDIPVTFGYINQHAGALWSVRHYQKLLPTFAHLPPKHQRLWMYVGLFPNLVLALYPDSMEFYMTLPIDAKLTRLIGGGYALADSRRATRVAQYLGARINRVTNREDDEFVRRLQEGMTSSVFPKPCLSSIEQGVRDFHREIQRVLPIATLENQPLPGTLAQANAQMRLDNKQI